MTMRTTDLIALAAGLALIASNALAQSSPAFGPLPTPTAPPPSTATEEMLLADYLQLLRQVSPNAEEGARIYLAAVQLRCARTLTSAELRDAFAQGNGNPALMGLIRAVYLKDTAMQSRLVEQLSCPPATAPGKAP